MEKSNAKKDPTKFWNEIKRIKGITGQETHKIIKDENGRKLETNIEVVVAFKNRMQRTFNISEEENENFDKEKEREVEEWLLRNRNNRRIDDIIDYEGKQIITEELVKDIIKSFKEKSPGPSGVTRNLLLNAPKKIIKQLAEIFTASLATGYFPKAFKQARIIMIPKPNKKTDQIENFRPISLLEIPGKILEKIIEIDLKYHLENEEILNNNQYGFRKGRGTETALAIFHETVAKHLASKGMISIVLRDVKGAFDKVWHKRLKYNIY